MDAFKVGAKGVSPAAARAEAKGARAAAAAAETVTASAAEKGLAGKRTGVDGKGKSGERAAEQTGQGAGERADAHASARAGYSSEAASHPFAVQARDESHLLVAIDVLQDPLVDAISPAKPRASEDAIMVQARELGLDDLISDWRGLELDPSNLVPVSPLDVSSHADGGKQNGDAGGKQNGDAGGKQNGDDVLGNGHNGHEHAHHRVRRSSVIKLQHAAHNIMCADTLDNRLYRSDSIAPNETESVKQAEVLIQELEQGGESVHGENCSHIEDMTSQPTTHTSTHPPEHIIPTHKTTNGTESLIERTPSQAHFKRLSSVFHHVVHHRRETKVRGILKTPASQLAQSKGLSSEAEGVRKRQRVRFFIAQTHVNTVYNIFHLWDPEGAFLSKWHSFLVIASAYEAWAGAFRLALGTPQERWLQNLDLCMDGVFGLDGLIFMNTALVTHIDAGHSAHSSMKADFRVIRNRWTICKHYFRNIFPTMMLPSIVYFVVTFSYEDPAPQVQGANLWWWWMASLPRLVFRWHRLTRYFREQKLNLNVSVAKMQLLMLVLETVLFAHWIGCLYFWAARMQPSGKKTWLDAVPSFFPEYIEGTAFQTISSYDFGFHYLLCFYRGVDGIVAGGYFPIVPTNNEEILVAIAVIFLSIYIAAYVLGTLFHYLLMAQKDPLKEAHNQKMQNLIAFMEERRLPLVTRKRLNEYFEFQYKKAVQKRSSAALKLPRSLEVKVANARFRPTLEKCCHKGQGRERGPFWGCSAQFLNAMVTKLRPVFLMPGDQFQRAMDMVLELCFVSSGYVEVMDGDTVKRVIRSDVESPSIVGEVSFFLGVQQQHSVRAPESSDIELLLLSKEAADELFRDFPEQQEIVNTNLLQKYNMNSLGDDLELDGGEDEEDPEAQIMRQILRDTVKRRHDEAFQALAWAATSGDLEEVRRMLRKGVGINSSNYDGRTVLHMAAVEGNFRVVELLLADGADRNKRDRWKNTALQDAINHNQGPVIQLLTQWKSELNHEHAAGRLCDAAGAGDLDTLKLILEHGVDPNCGDYDNRTPIHLAAAEGQDKAVQYLIAKGADVNCKDRWGATALQDAVTSGHVQVAEQILSRGGTLATSLGAVAMCNAATEGDVRYLKLLIRCGVEPDVGDYDSRFAPPASLVVCLPVAKQTGGTQRHLQCAKLLQCLGGKLGIFNGTPEGHEALSTLDSMDMEDVRKVIKLLIDQGLDSKKPERATYQECIIAYEASVELVQPVHEIKRMFDIVTARIVHEREGCRELLDVSCKTCAAAANFVDKMLPAFTAKTATTQSAQKDQAALHLFANDVTEFMEVLNSGQDPESLDHFFDFELDRATLEAYAELDHILSEQERDKFASRTARMMMARDINSYLMNLFKVEEMWRILCLGFSKAHKAYRADFRRGSWVDGHLTDLNMAELDDLWRYFDWHMTEQQNLAVYRQATESSRSGLMTPYSLLVGSSSFHRKLLEEESDDIGQLLCQSKILRVLAWHSILSLIPYSRQVKLEAGQSIRLKERTIVAVHTGSVKMKHLDASGARIIVNYGAGEVAGEAWTLLNLGAISSVMANSQSAIVLLPLKAFTLLFEIQPQLYRPITANFVSLVWMQNNVSEAQGNQPSYHEVHDSVHLFEAEMICAVFSQKEKRHKKDHTKTQLQSDINMDELKVFQGKSLDMQRHDEAIRLLMEHLREMTRVPWAESPLKPAFMAFIQWKTSFVSKRHRHADTKEQEHRKVLREGFKQIQGTWDVVSSGTNTIYLTELQSLKDHMGEVGMQFFDVAFKPDQMKEEITFPEWIECWLRYVDGHEDEVTVDSKDHGPADDEQNRSTHGHEQHGPVKKTKDDMQYKNDEPGDSSSNRIVMKIKETYVRLRHTPITSLLDDSEIARAYEPSFLAITGDLKNALDRRRVKEFLSLLLIDFDKELTDLHVDEFMNVFSPDGPKGEAVSWTDIERELRERHDKGLDPTRLFMRGFGSTFNPNSHTIRVWRTWNQICAIYLFLFVPVRIGFSPYPAMTDWSYTTICIDLLVDSCTVVNMLITLNTSYMNKKSRWVMDFTKIARHYLSTDFLVDILVAAPFDWFGYFSGASPRLSSCFRLPKMLWILVVFTPHRTGLLRPKVGIGKDMILTALLLHILACIWHLLGKDGPHDKFTWWRNPDHDFELKGKLYGEDLGWPFVYDGYGYQNDPDSTLWNSVWRQYLLSLYWVCSCVTTTGVIADMHPKNYIEVGFTMICFFLNLTVFSYVTGQLSTNVLKGDETVLKARGELGAVESYLNSFDFPDDLKLEIKRYFQGANVSSFLSASEIFDSVSQSLRLEMSSDVTRKCLDSCVLFNGCSKQMKDSIKGLLREVHFSSEEYLIQVNTVAHDMFFIMTGRVERISVDNDGAETVETRIGSGGSVGILEGYFGIRYMYSCRATSLSGPCLCLRLVRSQLMPILKAYPDDEEAVAQNAMSEFQKVKQEKSIAGNSVKGARSVKSGARSVMSEKMKIAAVRLEEEVEQGSEHSMGTGVDDNGDEELMAEKSVEAIILSGIEQKLASLNQRRKIERVAQFCSAASRGEIEKLQRGMRNGVHVDATDINGRTALHCAASEGRLETVSFLLEARASLNIQDSFKNTPLNDAVRHKHDDVALALRNCGARPITLPGFEMGVQMCTFAAEGNLDQLQRMLMNGVDVNLSDYDKRTALHLASSQGHLSIVEFLLEKGADVNCVDRMGFSPLVDALRHDHTAVQKFLRSRGGKLLGMEISVELCNAAAVGDVARMKSLIENGANPNAGDYDDRTALHLAASNGETSALDYLLRQSGVHININPLDRLGGTPIEDAYRHGQTVAVAMLQAVGGLRQDNAELGAMAEKVRSDTELIQRKERHNRVKDLVQNGPETRASVWVRGRCGKLLPGHLQDLHQMTKDLVDEMKNLIEAVSAFMKLAATYDDADLNVLVTTHEYRDVIHLTRMMSETVKQWRAFAQTASQIMGEEMPQCKAALIFSRQYKLEIKDLLELFKYCHKSLQFWRFLALKIPEVMRAEEEEEKINRTRGGVVEGEDNLTGFIDRMKKISEREREREKFIDNQTDD